MTTYKNQGDSLLGERIAVQARAIAPVRVRKGSHSHKIQDTTLRGSAFCVIELPLIGIQKKSKQ
jgi:hypothetical protein